MKPAYTLTLFLGLLSIASFGQSQWTNYTNDRLIKDVLVYGDDVWVGSQGGLTRTNLRTGEFQTFLPYNSPIKGGGIIDIERAPDNSFWMTSYNAGVFQLKNGTWTQYYEDITYSRYHEIKDLQILANGDVWFFVEDYDRSLHRLVRIRDGEIDRFGNFPEQLNSVSVLNDSTVYVSTNHTIQLYNPIQEQIVHVYDEQNSIINGEDKFYYIIADKNGSIIIPTIDRILQINNGTLSVLSTTGISATKVFKDIYGNVFLQSKSNPSNGILLIRCIGNSLTYYKTSEFKPYPVSTDYPIFRGVDSRGGLYAVLFNLDSEYILHRYFEGEWSPVKTQIYPLLDNYQEDVQSDCEGNLWFASRNGVDVKYADDTWEHFHFAPDQYSSFIAGQMDVDPVTCDVWVTNRSNDESSVIPGLVRISNGVVTNFLLGHANVHEVEITDEGKVYFYSQDSGFGYIENDEIHYIDENVHFNIVVSMDSDSKGNVYLATWLYELYKYDGMHLYPIGPEGFSSNASKVYVDNEDFLWVKFSSGLQLFDGIQWTDYSHVWAPATFNGMVQDRLGNYWVSTSADGLYYWNKHSYQQYTIFNSDLSSNNLRNVHLDPNDKLIVSQHVGASVLDFQHNVQHLKGTGSVFFDEGKDGAFTVGTDVLMRGQKVWDQDRDLWSVSNFHGKYTFYTDSPGQSTYEHILDEYSESTTENPQEGSLLDQQSVLPDFGFWKPWSPDVSVRIINTVPVCNRVFSVRIYLVNNSPRPITGNFSLYCNEELSMDATSIPITNSSPGFFVYENITIDGFGVRKIRIDFEAPGWDTENLSLFFNGIFDTSYGPFLSGTTDTLLCSYDPNDKKVEPTGEHLNGHSLIADPLRYTIRFQNEGTYKAFDITIIDTLDANLDPSTFELLAASHDVDVSITSTGIITCHFRDIDLPTRDDDETGSQGFVTFTVKPDSTLSDFGHIENTASIYFDFNPPIVTNTTQWNVVDNLSVVSTKELYKDLSLYPNPTNGILYLTTTMEGEYTIWESTGRLIDAGTIQAGSNTIHLDVPTGLYYFQLMEGSKMFAPVKVVVIK